MAFKLGHWLFFPPPDSNYTSPLPGSRACQFGVGTADTFLHFRLCCLDADKVASILTGPICPDPAPACLVMAPPASQWGSRNRACHHAPVLPFLHPQNEPPMRTFLRNPRPAVSPWAALVSVTKTATRPLCLPLCTSPSPRPPGLT